MTSFLVINDMRIDAGNVHRSDVPHEIKQMLNWWWSDTPTFSFQTSGSTGIPKTIQHSRDALLRSAQITNEVFGMTADSVSVLCLPAQFIAGAMVIIRALVGGYAVRFVSPSADPIHDLPNGKYDLISLTPLQLSKALETEEGREKLDRIGVVLLGGAPASQLLKNKIQTVKAKVVATYGMTETITHAAIQLLNGSDKDEYFHTLPSFMIAQDERGCAVISADHLPEPVITNDLIDKRPKGFVWLGRVDDIINTGGMKVNPLQMESDLEGIVPAPYAVSAVPDDDLGQKIVLAIRGEHMNTAEKSSVLLALNELFPGPNKLRDIRFVADFPMTSTGKLDRSTLYQILSSQSV